MFKHYIWDFDGTLYNSYPHMAGTLKEMLAEQGHFETLESVLHYMKQSMSCALDHYKALYGIDDSFIKAYEDRRKVVEIEQCQPFKEAAQACRDIVAAGGANYLYTHRGDTALTLLQKHGLMEYFSDCIIADDGFARKPSPDALHHLLTKHSIPADQALMIGDRDLDIQAAQNAGIKGCFYSEAGALCPIADYVITDFSDLLREL